MHGPAVVSWLLVALALGTGTYCLRRLALGCAGGHPADRRADGAEAAMGLGMAGMVLLPGVFWGWLYGALAGALLLGATGARVLALRAHRLHHGIGALAIAYSALTMSGSPAGHAHHHAQAGLPLMTGALLLYFGGYSLWAGRRLITVQGVHPPDGGTLTRACRVAMGIAMFAMLLTI